MIEEGYVFNLIVIFVVGIYPSVSFPIFRFNIAIKFDFYNWRISNSITPGKTLCYC